MSNKKKILYVDYDELNLLVFKRHLAKEYNVLLALDGSTGLEQLKENPDTEIVISDMQMPEMDGLEFISNAKEEYPNKKYMLVTAFSVITDRIQQALDMNLIVKHLSKPINKKN